MGLSRELQPACLNARSCRVAQLAIALALSTSILSTASAGAQFTEWDSFPVTGPFSVTAAMRGLNAPLEGGGPMVRFETLVGYNAGPGNRFDYHASVPLPAEVLGPFSRRVDTHGAIDFTSSGVQSSLNGLCCSNNGKGLDNDTSLHYLTNFGTTTTFEVLIGTPEAGVVEVRELHNELTESGSGSSGDADSDSDSDSDSGGSSGRESRGADEGPVGFLRIVATSAFPGSGINILSKAGAGDFVLETTIPDCRGVNSNWHFAKSASSALQESYIACATTANNFVIKRVSHLDFSVQQIVLNSGLPPSSSLFTYLHTGTCELDTGVVVGVMEPRADLGITNFHAVFLNPAGNLMGTASIQLPGARANRQAFTCVDGRLPNPQNALFLYHGSGATAGTTDTFLIQTNVASTNLVGVGEPMLVKSTTENRRTDWAAVFPRVVRLTDGRKIGHTFAGLRPVAELDFGSPSEVRYGGVEMPLFLDNFESGDLRYWGAVVAGLGDSAEE